MYQTCNSVWSLIAFLHLFPFHSVILLPQYWASFIDSIPSFNSSTSWKSRGSFLLFLKLCFLPGWILYYFHAIFCAFFAVANLRSCMPFLFLLHVLMMVPNGPDLLFALLSCGQDPSWCFLHLIWYSCVFPCEPQLFHGKLCVTWRHVRCEWEAMLAQLQVPEALSRALPIALSSARSCSVSYPGQPSSQRYVPLSWALSHLHVLGKTPKNPEDGPSARLCNLWCTPDVLLTRIFLFSSPGLHSHTHSIHFSSSWRTFVKTFGISLRQQMKRRILVSLKSVPGTPVSHLRGRWDPSKVRPQSPA